MTASLGINYSTTLTTSEQAWSPKAYVALTYDVMSDNSKSIVNIADSVYNVNGRRLNRFGVETGLGAEVSLGAWDLSAEYDFGIRHNYTNNTGMLRAKYNFQFHDNEKALPDQQGFFVKIKIVSSSAFRL